MKLLVKCSGRSTCSYSSSTTADTVVSVCTCTCSISTCTYNKLVSSNNLSHRTCTKYHYIITKIYIEYDSRIIYTHSYFNALSYPPINVHYVHTAHIKVHGYSVHVHILKRSILNDCIKKIDSLESAMESFGRVFHRPCRDPSTWSNIH